MGRNNYEDRLDSLPEVQWRTTLAEAGGLDNSVFPVSLSEELVLGGWR